MSEKSYQIVVTGELMEGTYLPDVKAKLAAMFNTPAEKLDPLFSGNRVVIKKGLGEEGAKKYLAAVQAAGLRCAAEDMAEKAPQASPAATMADVSLAPVGTTFSDLSMAAVGEDLVERAPPEAPAIDTSALSVAPPGTQLVEKEEIPPPAIDTSNLDMAPVGSDVGEKKREDGPPPPDTSHLKLD